MSAKVSTMRIKENLRGMGHMGTETPQKMHDPVAALMYTYSGNVYIYIF